MNKIAAFLLVVFVLVAAASAQSGRKKTAPASPSAPVADQSAPPRSVAGDWSEYSESAPNAARLVWARPDSKKKTDKVAQPKPVATPAATAAPPADGDEVLKVESSLVTVPVSVYDRNGLYIPHLRRTDFKIFEDGVEQEITYFGTSEQPFTVVLLMDVSPSTSLKIEDIQQAAITFVDQLKPTDAVMVIQFDERVSTLAELTTDRQKIYKAIRKTGFGGGTSLYEAVDYSLRRKLDKIEGRKAIVLFTDGVDTTSMRASFESTLREAEESDSLVFPIYYNTFLDTIGIGGSGGPMSTPPTLGLPPGLGGMRSTAQLSEDYNRGRAYLNELAAVTGGRVFRAESTPGGLASAFEGIAQELGNQYSIGYAPVSPGDEGQRKQIRVRVNRPKLVIRARDSYIVGSGKATATSGN
jgi:VWFA-related protein